MKATLPKVSIGLPVYNGEKYLGATLNSLLGQSFSDFELIISDNASLDGTEAICRDYAAMDLRIRYVRNKHNIGLSGNYNRVFELSAGQYFKWSAHDDLYAPSYLAKCVAALDRDPAVVLCHSKTKHIDSHGVRLRLNNCTEGPVTDSEGFTHVIADDPPRRLDSPRTSVRLSEILLKTVSCAEVFGLIRSNLLKGIAYGTYPGCDKVVLAELAMRGRFFQVPEYLFSRRFHVEQSSVLDALACQRLIDPRSSKLRRFHSFPRYWQAVWKVPLSHSQRVLCHCVLLKYACTASAELLRRELSGAYAR